MKTIEKPDYIDCVKKYIDFFDQRTVYKKLEKGFSGDAKYKCYFNEKIYLLRLIDPRRTEKNEGRKYVDKIENIVDILTKCYDIGARVPRVNRHGYIDKLDRGYIITDYIEGEALQDSFCKLTEKQQYKIGLDLGTTINAIHSSYNQIDLDVWGKSILNPMYNNHKLYESKKMDLPILMDQEIEYRLLEYIEENKDLIRSSIGVVIHNDVHDGNIIVKDGKFVGLIDFTEIMYGDPLYDNKFLNHSTVWDAPYFSAGVLHGKFGKNIPNDVWRKLYLYIAIDIIKYNPLAHLGYFTVEDAKFEFELNKKMFDTLHKFESYPPKWYSKLDKSMFDVQ